MMHAKPDGARFGMDGQLSGFSGSVITDGIRLKVMTADRTKLTGVYSAPRSFDLFTIFFVTAAYAVLFAMLQALDFSLSAVLLVAGFFMAIMFGQAILFRGNRPRLSSLLVGLAYFLIACVAVNPRFLATRPLALIGAFGVILGYIAGVVVGFVFMIADITRKTVASKRMLQ